MRILLISPMIAQVKTHPPLGLCYIQSCLDKAGYTDSKIVDAYNSYDEIKKIIKDYNPDIVGISCFTMYRGSSFKLAKLTKKIKPDVKIILGGPHATFMWEQIMKNFDFVDFIVVGEGEITTIQLVEALDKGLPLKDVKGIVFRKNGKVIKTGQRPFIKNIDRIPFPSYRDINFADYAVAKSLEHHRKSKCHGCPGYCAIERKAGIITSRGCIFDCNFCANVKFWSRKWRPRSAKNVVDEIEWLYKNHNIEFFTFYDDIFTNDPKRVIKICKEIIKRKLKIRWYVETRVDRVSKEVFEWMKKAGCIMVQFGVESGSEKILRNVNKKITRKYIINAFKLAKEVGLKTEMFLMVGNPGETKETIDETKGLIDMLKPDVLVAYLTRVLPSTRLYEMAKQKKLIDDDFWLTENVAPEYTVEHSLQELVLMRIGIVKQFYETKGRFAYLNYLFDLLRSSPKIVADHLKVLSLGKKTLAE